jgi:hypothetical protein
MPAKSHQFLDTPNPQQIHVIMAREGADFELDRSGATGISVVFNEEREIVGEIERKIGRVVQRLAACYVVDELCQTGAVFVYRENAGVGRNLGAGVQVVVRLGEKRLSPGSSSTMPPMNPVASLGLVSGAA